MKAKNKKTSVELSFKKAKQLDFFDELVMGLGGKGMEEIKEEKPRFKFFKNREAEMFVGKSHSNSSDGYISIGDVGVERDHWENFLEELEE